MRCIDVQIENQVLHALCFVVYFDNVCEFEGVVLGIVCKSLQAAVQESR